MILLQPEQCITYQKTAHFIAAIIENETIPILMNTLAWISTLEQVSPIEVPQTMLIFGKMRWYPIKQHANTMTMQAINEVHKILWCTVATGRRKVARHFVSPRTIKWMLHHRQKLHVGEAHFLYILR